MYFYQIHRPVAASTSFSTTPSIKFLVDTYRNLANSNALAADVSLNNVMIFGMCLLSFLSNFILFLFCWGIVSVLPS
jgi:hypothetical protein